MDFPNDIKDDNDPDKTIASLDQCVLVFLCPHCGRKVDTLESHNHPNSILHNPNIIDGDMCPSCKNKLSRCSVCSCPIKLSNKSNNECLVFCIKCSHGGHYEHYKGWFREFNECPNSQCDCRCQQEEIKEYL